MVGWYHRLNGHEFQQALGDGKGQGSLACCSPWGRNESDATERLNNNLFARLQLTYPSLRNLAPLSLSVFNLFGQSHVTACLLSDFCHLLSLPDFSRWPDAPSVFTSDICAYLAWPLEPNGIQIKLFRKKETERAHSCLWLHNPTFCQYTIVFEGVLENFFSYITECCNQPVHKSFCVFVSVSLGQFLRSETIWLKC